MQKDLSILFVPFGTERIAATRYRVYQYLPYLMKHSIRFKVFSIISDKTTREMINSSTFTGLRKITYYFKVVLEKIIRFLPILILARKYKILFLQRTTFPFGLERILKMMNENIVFDLDDAIFIPDKKEYGLIGRMKEYSKEVEVANILRVSKLAIVENEYIKKYASKYCKDIFLIPGPIDTKRNFVKKKSYKNNKVTIGWIGSPSTLNYLNMLDGVFKELAKKFDVEIKVIGAGEYKLDGIKVTNINWSVENEVEELQSFDIGVMPMPNNEWTRGKLGCKMLQYMAVGVPAVVSYTATNAEVISDGLNGFLINSEKECLEKLSLLIKDFSLREKIGKNGRRTVEEKFSLDVNAPKFRELLEKYF